MPRPPSVVLALSLVAVRFAPESAGQYGITGLDEDVTTITDDAMQQARSATEAALAKLEALRKTASNPMVQQDLDVLIDSARDNLRGADLARDRLIPYADVTGLVFGGLRSLLDPQVAPERRPAAVVRLRKYAGLTGGRGPITEQAMRRTRARIGNATLLPPARSQVERDLANGPVLIQGIEKLLTEYKLDGWQEPFAALETQLTGYDAFVRKEVLPRARTDFRLPEDLYASV